MTNYFDYIPRALKVMQVSENLSYALALIWIKRFTTLWVASSILLKLKRVSRSWSVCVQQQCNICKSLNYYPSDGDLLVLTVILIFNVVPDALFMHLIKLLCTVLTPIQTLIKSFRIERECNFNASNIRIDGKSSFFIESATISKYFENQQRKCVGGRLDMIFFSLYFLW